MKRILILLCGIILFSFSSCNNNDSDSDIKQESSSVTNESDVFLDENNDSYDVNISNYNSDSGIKEETVKEQVKTIIKQIKSIQNDDMEAFLESIDIKTFKEVYDVYNEEYESDSSYDINEANKEMFNEIKKSFQDYDFSSLKNVSINNVSVMEYYSNNSEYTTYDMSIRLKIGENDYDLSCPIYSHDNNYTTVIRGFIEDNSILTKNVKETGSSICTSNGMAKQIYTMAATFCTHQEIDGNTVSTGIYDQDSDEEIINYIKEESNTNITNYKWKIVIKDGAPVSVFCAKSNDDTYIGSYPKYEMKNSEKTLSELNIK